ncbi:hypothetical protein RI129_007645 [Pyrocoelia pectoralis]|uniref:Gem-associated protein 5 n=1 Tax=Pyrocoelia pectoralis TaxID=417401 RepID=A0AAN7V8F3_9COLE
MNKLVIPPSPNWFASNILACASDNTVIYGSRQDVIVIQPAPPDEPADVKVLSGIHSGRVSFVSLNINWGNPNKWAVSVAEDNVVQLLDIATSTPKMSHMGHKTHSDRLIGAVFAGEDKVVSVSERGFMIIWTLSTNNLTPINTLNASSVRVSTISSCPHAPWLISLGLKKGGIIIMDLKKMGKVLFKIRAHEDEVISLSWCPTPYNIFPQNIVRIQNIKHVSKTKSDELSSDKAEEAGCSSLVHHSSDDENLTVKIESTDDSETVAIKEEVNLDANAIFKTDPESDSTNLLEDKDELKKNLHTEDVKEPSVPKVTADECNVVIKQFSKDQPSIISTTNTDEIIERDSDTADLLSDNEQQSNFTNCNSSEMANRDDDNKVCTSDAEGLVKTAEEVVTKIENEIGQYFESSDSEATHSKDDTVDDIKSADVQPFNSISKVQFCISNLSAIPTPVNSPISGETIGIDPASMSLTQESVGNLLPVQELEESLNLEVDDVKTSEPTAPRKEFLLASSAKGSRSIKIWRAGSNGLLQTEIFPPIPYHKRLQKTHDKSWLTTCWITPTELLSSSNKGQLLLWKLTNETENNSGRRNYFYRVIHADHSKYIFCIAAAVRKYQSIEIGSCGEAGELSAWTLGNDRFILNTSLGVGNTNLVTYSTVGGTVTCMIPSAITPTRIACGLNDGNNRIWDLSQPHLQRVILTPIFEKHTIKVTTFAWHPTNEDCLAYGTIDGYIGLIDTGHLSKNPIHFVQSCTLPVLHLQWGPLNKGTSGLGLYTVSNGKLVVYDIKQPLHEPATIEFDVDYNLTSFSWKPDYSILAVATKNLELLLYNHEFKLLNTFLLQSKVVRCLAWHSLGTTEENWLAISSNHVIVWNVKTQTLLHACHCYFDILYSVVWSPLDCDYLITGGKACTIRIWKLTENPPTLRPENDNEKVVIKIENKLRKKCFLNGIAQVYNVNTHSDLLPSCKQLFSICGKEIDEVQKCNIEIDKESELNVLNLFGDKDGIAKILQLEQNHLNRTTPLSLESTSLWQGDIDETIKNAIKCGSLNSWLVGVAPMVSHNLWQEACESYASQLLNTSNSKPVEASFYYLACHKIEEAIEALCSGSYFREALILAKSRLSLTDPIINNVIERWAKYSISVGSYEVAAQCFLVLNKIEEAAKILFRRTDIPTLEFCVTLAKEIGNEDMLNAILFRLNSFKSELVDIVEDSVIPLPTRLEVEAKPISNNSSVAERSEDKTEQDELVIDTIIST